MVVCAHGDVDGFCDERDMVILERSNDIEGYNGVCRVLVTDQEMSEYEYYFLKGKMLAKKVELISTRYSDRGWMAKYLIPKKHERYGGRNMFGFRNGELTAEGAAVVRRIFELRDVGYTYARISEDSSVYHLDGSGRKIGISTIQIILKNRERYEEKLYGEK